MMTIRTLLEDGSVEVTGSVPRLYGALAVSYSEVYSGIPLEAVKSFWERYFGEDRPAWVWCGIKRTKVRNYPGKGVFPYRTEVLYLFETKEDRDFFASQVSSLKPLSAVSLANLLFRFHALVSPYWFSRKGVGLKDTPVIKPDTIYSALLRDKYKDFVLNELEKARCREEFPFRVYKGITPLTENPDLEKFFKTPWEGVVWIKAGFGNFYNTLKVRAQTLSFEKASFWKEIAEKHRTGELPLSLVEITAITPENSPFPQTAGSYLSVSTVEWFVNWTENVFNPVFTYDDSFAHFFDLERTALVLPSSFGKASVRKGEEPVLIYGHSPSPVEPEKGELFYFHLAEEGKFHSYIVAPQRSGKSFTNQIIISQLTGVDVRALYYGKIKPFRFPVKVVQFDVGFSVEFFVTLLKERGFSVRIFPPKRDVKINPLEIDSKDEISLAVSLLSLLWETRGNESFTVEELGLLEKALKVLFENRQNWSCYGIKEISSLKESHPHLYDLALEKGYRPTSLLRELEGEKEFRNFFYPTVFDLLRVLKKLKELSRNRLEKETLERLIYKIKGVTELENFNTYSSVSFSPVDYFYVDLHYVKEVKDLFVPLYLALLNKTMKMVSKFPFSTPKYLSVDEFHNFTRYKAFENYFEVLVREAAKRNIYLTFISQNAEDLPERIVHNVRTRIILKGQEGSRKESDFLDSVRKRLSVPDEALKRYAELPRYSALVVYGEGSFFGASFPVTDESLKVFESRKIPVLKTPDGIVIKKSFVEGETS